MHAFRTYIFAKAYTRCSAVWLRYLTYLFLLAIDTDFVSLEILRNRIKAIDNLFYHKLRLF